MLNVNTKEDFQTTQDPYAVNCDEESDDCVLRGKLNQLAEVNVTYSAYVMIWYECQSSIGGMIQVDLPAFLRTQIGIG